MSLAGPGWTSMSKFSGLHPFLQTHLHQVGQFAIDENINFTTGETTGKVELADMPQHKFEPEALSKSFAAPSPIRPDDRPDHRSSFAGAYISFLKYDVAEESAMLENLNLTKRYEDGQIAVDHP